MTSNPPRGSLHPYHPKTWPAAPTAKASSISTLPQTLQLSSRPQSRLQPRKAVSRAEQADATTDKAIVALIRRVLCPQTGSYGTGTPRPLEELLPPLTSSNEVDRQLYAIIAIIIKEFVYAWYAKITPDHVFVDEIVQVIAHCTRALEERLRRIDVAELVFDELPGLIEAHIMSYRMAQQKSNLVMPRYSPRVIYHTLNPHPGLSPVPDPSDAQTITQQRDNELVYRQLLAQSALAVLLPTEDLENICLRTLVGDILADLILGNEVSGRACEGWFVWDTVTRLIAALKHRDTDEKISEETGSVQQSRLERFGLLSTKEELDHNHSSNRDQSQTSIWIWTILQGVYLAYVSLRFVVTGLFRVASTLPATPSRAFVSASSNPISRANEAPSSGSAKRPVLDYRVYGMLSQLVNVPRRMPWLGGTLSLLQYLVVAGPGRLGDTGGILDRFLHETIKNYVLTPTFLPTLLVAIRTALFPSNARPTPLLNVNANNQVPPPSAPDSSTRQIPAPGGAAEGGASIHLASNSSNGSRGAPLLSSASPGSASSPSPEPQQQQRPSEAEIAAIKRQCAASILSLIPRQVALTFFGVSKDVITTASAAQRHEEQKKKRDQSPVADNKGGGGDEDQSSHSREASPSPTPSTLDEDVEESLLLSAIETEILDLFADEYCNKHLVYAIIETVLVRLLPELSERSVAELMDDRGVIPSSE